MKKSLPLSGIPLLLATLLAAVPAAAADKFPKLMKQYPGIKLVTDSQWNSACTEQDRKKRNVFYSVLEAPAPGGGMPLRGIGFSGDGYRGAPVAWLLPMAQQEILQGYNGCFYLVRGKDEPTFTIWRVNSKRQLVRGDTTKWEIAQYLPGALLAVGGPADAAGGRELTLLDSNTGEDVFRIANVAGDARRMQVHRPLEHKAVTNPGPDLRVIHVYQVGSTEPMVLINAPSEAVAAGGKRIHEAADGSGFWLNTELYVLAQRAGEGPRYRLFSLGDRRVLGDFLQQEFSRILHLGYASQLLEPALDAVAMKALLQPQRSLFAFEVIGPGGSRHWQILDYDTGLGNNTRQTLERKYASLELVDWSDGAGPDRRVIAREQGGELVLISEDGEPVEHGRGPTVAAIRATLDARALVDAEEGRKRAQERAEREDRIRQAEAYYADQRAIEATQMRRRAEAEAARRANGIGAALNSISDSVVNSLSTSAPSGPPPGINQGVYDSRNDATGAGANSYQKALEREADRRARCTGAGC